MKPLLESKGEVAQWQSDTHAPASCLQYVEIVPIKIHHNPRQHLLPTSEREPSLFLQISFNAASEGNAIERKLL